jgi:non-heme Fe2+,alpha-ketoglutarate-dependent halogenase
MTPDALDFYRTQGYLAPLPALPPADIAACMDRLAEAEATRGGRIGAVQNIKIHLLLPWIWDLVHDPRILDPVAEILGPDVLCWASGFFDKRPGEPAHVPWHQDATYWGLTEPRALTAWLAFTPSIPENGCLRVVPGTHRAPLRHRDTGDRTNMLPGREEVAVDVDENDAVDIALSPGEMSLHHLLLVHGSRANGSGMRRCGLAIRYIAGDLGRVRGAQGTATLARGRDHGGFALEQAPEGPFHPAATARYRDIVRIWTRGVFDEIGHRQAEEG